jgi:hypothetical protein
MIQVDLPTLERAATADAAFQAAGLASEFLSKFGSKSW